MRSSVARCARRIVRVIGPVSAMILAGVATAQAQAVPRQPPPPNSPAPASAAAAAGNQRARDRRTAVTGRRGQHQARLRGGARRTGPILNFSAEGVSLEEALRLTLRHAPDIHLSAASADRAAGFAQEQSGIFDTAITGGVEYSYRVQELTESAQGRRAQQAAEAR